MAEQINLFQKGIVSDLDPMMVKNDQWVFPTLNVRFINKDGQGIIAVPLDSNTHQTNGVPDGVAGEEFLIREDHAIIGACEYNGIAYIVSVNTITGAGEIGTYPSPRAITSFNINTGVVSINQSLSGFNRQYRPLVNFTGVVTNYNPANRIAFNSTLFNFSTEHRVDMFAKPDYDGSVNLYLADGINQLRHINTGFDQSGVLLTDRLYCNVDFGSKLNSMPTTNSNMTINPFVYPANGSGSVVENYGTLKFGNYYFFFQYATKNFDATEFVTQCGPIQIDDSGDSCANSFGGNAGENSNKKILFRLSNIDKSYPFIKVGYTRYFSDNNNIVQTEHVLIEHYYSTESNELIVTGSEANYPISAADLIEGFPDERIPKSIDQSENRFFGANWKVEDRNLELLAEFFSLVELKWEDAAGQTSHENLISGQPINDANYDLKDISQNRNYTVTINKNGYFRSEAYPFACLVEFPNGSFSKAFIPKGIDSLLLSSIDVDNAYNNPTDPNAGKVNDKGFLRFPTTVLSHTYNGFADAHRLHILSVVYDFTKAMVWLAAQTPAIQLEINSMIRRIHFARGDRFVNLRYQGLCVASAMAMGNELTAIYTDMVSLPNPYSIFSYPANGFNYAQGSIFLAPDTPMGSSPTFNPGDEVGHDYTCGQPIYDFTDGSIDSDHQGHFNSPHNGVFNGDDAKYSFRYREVHAPFFRGYTPMMWYRKDSTTGGYMSNDKCPVVNYANRFYCQPGKYGFFSPDFLIQPNNDISGIKHMFRAAKTMHATRAFYADTDASKNSIIYKSNTPYACDGWSMRYSRIHGESNMDRTMFPRGYHADVVKYWYDDGMLNPDQPFYHRWDKFTIDKIGEASARTCQDAVVGNNKFINYSSDFYHDIGNCLFYADKTQGRDYVLSTRSFYMPKYIAIDTTLDSYGLVDNNVITQPGAWTGNYNLDIVNLCNQDPQNIDIKNLGDPLAIAYKKIGDNFSLEELDKSPMVNTFHGDCFLQRVYYKHTYWDGSNFGSGIDHEGWNDVGFDTDVHDNGKSWQDTPKAYFTHGVIIGAVFECAYNINMRIPGEETTFFPKANSWSFSKNTRNGSGTESWMANNGYNQILSEKTFFAYDKYLPVDVSSFPVRIRHSDQHIEGSFIDNYRIIKPGYYKDFNSANGSILSIRDFSGTLFSVQERAINRHFTNEEQIKVQANTSELIIGTGPILHHKVQNLADYGTQHQFSVIRAMRGIYGVDVKRRIAWRASVAATANGTISGAIQMLSSEKLNETWLYDLIERNSLYSDIIENYPDNTIDGIGVHAGYDKNFNEVLFTFMFYNGIQDRIPTGRTLVFSEKLDQFVGEYSSYPAIYWNTNTELFSALSTDKQNYAMAFLHNQKDSCLMFYGDQEQMELSVIVNGVGDSTEKAFLAYNVESKHYPFYESQYETKNQIGLRTPFIDPNRFWANPEYLEHHWQCPIFVKTDADNHQFYIDSSMRGTWMKTTLVYRERFHTFIKKIVTFFNSSHA